MLIPTLASAVLVIGGAAAGALGLLIVLFLRQSKRIEAMAQDLERVAKEQRDGAADVRGRLEEGQRELQAVHTAVETLPAAVSRVETVASEVKAEVGALGERAGKLEATVSGHEARVAKIQAKLDEVAQHGSEGVELVRAEWAQIEAMIARSERQLAAFENGRDDEAKRLEELRSVVGSLRGTVEEKMDEQARRIGALEAGPMKQIAQAAAGLESEAEDGGEAASAASSTAIAESPKEAAPAAAPAPAPAIEDEYDPEDEASGARWIFLVLAALLGLALLAQWIQKT